MKTVKIVIWIAISMLIFSRSMSAQLTDLVVSAGERVGLNQKRLYGELRVERDGLIEMEMLGSEHDLYMKSGFLEITAHTIQMVSGSKVQASGEGFGVTVPAPMENYGGRGESYGGHGGSPVEDDRWPTHGNEDLPMVMRGVHGANGPDHVNLGGPGGGALTLRGDTLLIDGEVNCNGWVKDGREQTPGHGHLGQLKGDIARMAHNFFVEDYKESIALMLVKRVDVVRLGIVPFRHLQASVEFYIYFGSR